MLILSHSHSSHFGICAYRHSGKEGGVMSFLPSSKATANMPRCLPNLPTSIMKISLFLHVIYRCVYVGVGYLPLFLS